MTAIRQDAWSGDDDLILAEIVLRHIRDGSTQLAAFEEVGARLSRTSAACGFRWNSIIRRKYESAISLAKKQRTKEKKQKQASVPYWDEESAEELVPITMTEIEPTEPTIQPVTSEEITMEKVVAFLREYDDAKKTKRTNLEIEELENENNQLKMELEKERNRNTMIEEDYRSLLSILDRARKRSPHTSPLEY